MMIGELSIINEWIPEQMEPGTVFVLENAGEVGEKEDPSNALACRFVLLMGFDFQSGSTGDLVRPTSMERDRDPTVTPTARTAQTRFLWTRDRRCR